MTKRILNNTQRAEFGPGPIVYWMSRDQRVSWNWALSIAQHTAIELKRPLIVVFGLSPAFLQAQKRQFDSMKRGLFSVQQQLAPLNIPFYILEGDPAREIARFATTEQVSAIYTDFSPLRIKQEWETSVRNHIKCPLITVDAHNIIPVWEASPKQEFAARTIRTKLWRKLSEFETRPQHVIRHPTEAKPIQFLKEKTQLLLSSFSTSESPQETALSTAKNFLSTIAGYAQKNNPGLEATSRLSSALHFGHLSAQQLFSITNNLPISPERDSFIEEFFIRRELAENYCFYQPDYDNFDGFPTWARVTLLKHARDKREYHYSLDTFEKAQTHDIYWNAAQQELLQSGFIHGYMRMYWAKKILEWTHSPQEAQSIAIYLNDTYQFDGRDPNGYAGIAWSIGGVHDRPWFDRAVFGNIRYMNASGLQRKFPNIASYTNKWLNT